MSDYQLPYQENVLCDLNSVLSLISVGVFWNHTAQSYYCGRWSSNVSTVEACSEQEQKTKLVKTSLD